MKSERGNCEGGKKEEEKVKDKTGHVEVIQETVQGYFVLFYDFFIGYSGFPVAIFKPSGDNFVETFVPSRWLIKLDAIREFQAPIYYCY